MTRSEENPHCTAKAMIAQAVSSVHERLIKNGYRLEQASGEFENV